MVEVYPIDFVFRRISIALISLVYIFGYIGKFFFKFC